MCECEMLSNFFPSAARADQNFRNGLLQGFTAANKLAKSNTCLVRKFAVLTAPLSIQNGELNVDGSVSFSAPSRQFESFKFNAILQVNRAGVKRKHLKIVEEMFPAK